VIEVPIGVPEPGAPARSWWTDLDRWDAAEFVDLLADDERRRAQRLRSAVDRRRAVIARGLLRRLLGAATGTAPEAVMLTTGPWGKPRFDVRPGAAVPTDLGWNHARSGPIALYAVVAGRRVGVDVERLRPLHDGEAVARASLAPSELDAVASLTGSALDDAVLRAWTLKEAFLKALGTGLSCAPERVELTTGSLRGAPASLRALDGDPTVASRWSLASIVPVAGTLAALAVERVDDSIRSASRGVRCRR
jgi:4'-phosphopantetheinyl transferase